MKRVLLSIRWVAIAVVVTAALCCNKSTPFTLVDPETGQPPVALSSAGGDCLITKIAQKNSGTGADNVFEIGRDQALVAQSVSSYDSLLKKQDYKITMTAYGDSIRLSTGEYFLLDKTTKQVVFFSTRLDVTDPSSDPQTFRYVYDANGYLVSKLNYINGATSADLETTYSYSNGVLKTCTVTSGANKAKLLVSTLDYDTTTARKPWIYLFTDFFEGYYYLQALPFGKKGAYPVTRIVTKVYDTNDGSELDSWNTSFSGFVFSQDNFILQASVQGDLQQGLGLLYGTTRFTYQCNK